MATLRKARDMTQTGLARAAGVSLSTVSKIELGDRALTQGMAAAFARALGVTLAEVLGTDTVKPDESESLYALRATIRRFDLPGESVVTPESLRHGLTEVIELRGDANLTTVLARLPQLLSDTTNYAHAAGSPEAWAMVADLYSAVYWLAARHRWMDLADLAVLKQKLAAERATPLVTAIAARDEAGAFLNSGDFDGGLAVVERAIVATETTLNGREKALGLGILHLRGLTLAGRMGNSSEAERHSAGAWQASEEFPVDVNAAGITFGAANTATHVLATAVDLEHHREALDIAQRLEGQDLDLPATRVGPLHMNIARAKLALGDRDGALASLADAWDAAPQMSKVHPTSRELMRVLISLHKRSNPVLTKLARKARVHL